MPESAIISAGCISVHKNAKIPAHSLIIFQQHLCEHVLFNSFNFALIPDSEIWFIDLAKMTLRISIADKNCRSS